MDYDELSAFELFQLSVVGEDFEIGGFSFDSTYRPEI